MSMPPTFTWQATTTESSTQCPRCGGDNPRDAVFCSHAGCGKALGELPFPSEDFAARETTLALLAERVANWVGHPNFVSLHLLWFALWVWLNAGIVASVPVFDAYPYGLLGIILAVEAALVTSLLLIDAKRSARYEALLAAQQYEASVRCYRLLLALQERLK